MKLIETLTEVKKTEGEEMSMSLLHPGAYLHKTHGKKYVIDLQAIAFKSTVSEVTLNTLAFPNGNMCERLYQYQRNCPRVWRAIAPNTSSQKMPNRHL